MTDLFASTPEYYARYRPSYPAAVVGRIRAAFSLDGAGRLLDLGCGTGELARPLHAEFEDVVGIDSSPEMITEARRQSERAGIGNIRWGCMPAEEISGEHRWARPVDIDAILGELYSTSFANKALLGEKADGFEAELRRSLLALESSGQFVQHLRTEYNFAYKR